MKPNDYFNFDAFITPFFVEILHYISIVLCMVVFIYGLVKGINDNSAIYIFVGIFGAPILYFVIRILLERMIVIFRIHNEVFTSNELLTKRK